MQHTPTAPDRMTSATFRALREHLGLPGSWCARRWDVAERTVRKWDQGEAPIPLDVSDALLALAAMTRDRIEREALILRADPASWPYEIPRGVQDLEGMFPVNGMPLDWWRNVGARLMEAVPGLWLEWIDLEGEQ